MNNWKPNNPPTEADHLNAAGLFGADLERATAALDKLEERGADRVKSRKFLGRVASSNILAGQDVVVMRDQGFEVDVALSVLPKYAGVDVWELIREGRVPFWDVVEAIEVAA